MTIPRQKITQLLADKCCKPFGQVFGRDVWVAEDGTVIRLPAGNRISIDDVEVIALEQLNMSMWEYDYWLGQIGYAG